MHTYVPHYFSKHVEAPKVHFDYIVACVDNDASRMDIMDYSDKNGIPLIIAANEEFSAEAMIYFPEWKDTPRDPRVIHSEYHQRLGRDPRVVSCTSEEAGVQTGLANMFASAFAMKLIEAYSTVYSSKSLLAPHSFYVTRGTSKHVTNERRDNSTIKG